MQGEENQHHVPESNNNARADVRVKRECET